MLQIRTLRHGEIIFLRRFWRDFECSGVTLTLTLTLTLILTLTLTLIHHPFFMRRCSLVFSLTVSFHSCLFTQFPPKPGFSPGEVFIEMPGDPSATKRGTISESFPTDLSKLV